MIADLPVFEEMPAGWAPLSGAVTAPIGYLVASNGKSRFNKEYKSGLVKDHTHRETKHQIEKWKPNTVVANIKKESKPVENAGVYFSDEPDLPERLNTLAREQMKLRLLKDIQMDICVCQIEGIDYRPYLMELKEEIEHFLN